MKRVITIILAMAMALSICSVAYAENGEAISLPSHTLQPRQIQITVLLQQKRMTVLSRRTQVPSI